MDVVTLHCGCGRTVRAPGAVPGRVGRCPACGAMLVVPDAGDPDRAERPGPREPGTGFDPESSFDEPPPPDPDRVLPSKDRLRESAHRSRRGGDAPKTRIPKLRVARPPKVGTGNPFAYPFWDETALAILALMPPAMTLPTLFSIGLVPNYLMSGNLVTMLGATLMVIPMGMILANMVGFALMFLGDVLTASAGGEHLHPKWPDWSPLGPIQTLIQWVAAFAPGAIVAWSPYATWGQGFAPTPINLGLIAIGCIGTMAYGLMAAYAALAHEVIAVSPTTALMGILRAGPGYARPVILGTFVLGILIGIVAFLFKQADVGTLIFLTWLAWVVALYLLTVAMRSAGSFFHRRHNALRWFADRPNRDALPPA